MVKLLKSVDRVSSNPTTKNMGLWDSFLNRFREAYELEDLLKARTESLGKGTYVTTYKASMDSGLAVVMKRFKHIDISEEDFKAKVEEIGKLDHQNLVALRAYCFTSKRGLLVYDYFPLGSVYSVLHGDRVRGRTRLNWATRSMIAHGAACGIQYIHSQGPTIYHGNIKSSNILLSKNYEARVSDFGVAQLVIGYTSSFEPRMSGYHAPEVLIDPCNISQKSDVYRFGVFLVELLSEKVSVASKDGMDLPIWVQSVMREECSSQVFEQALLDQYSNEDEVTNVKEVMLQFLQIAIDCMDLNPDSRPTMVDVTARIERICGFRSMKPQIQDVNMKVTTQQLRELCLAPR